MSEKQVPFGFIEDQLISVPDYGAINALWRGGNYGVVSGAAPAREVMQRMIWDGEKFVPFDGYEGADVLNKLLQGIARGAI